MQFNESDLKIWFTFDILKAERPGIEQSEECIALICNIVGKSRGAVISALSRYPQEDKNVDSNQSCT